MLVLLLCALLHMNVSEKVDWNTATEIHLFGQIQISDFDKLTKEEIASKKAKRLDLEKAKYYLLNSKPLNEMIMWKGSGYLVLVKFQNGSSRKLLVNKFGGTFRDGVGKTNYQIDENLRDEWHAFISSQ
ncbi:hypothetical protein [Chitinophaga sp. 22620]|uniref:hypothetical protein n=1 Tax=Chitinophaga sp. 22620 TaxID=3453952 RepID=UPI003F84C57B